LSSEQKAYWNHEVSKILGIGESTLRKWCLALEKNGYTFIRGTKDSRAFTQHDLNATTYFKDLTKVKRYTIDQAAKLVVEKYGEREGVERTVPVIQESNRSFEEFNDNIKLLVELSLNQEENNKKLMKHLAASEELIKEQKQVINQLLQEREEKLLIETRSIESKTEEEETKKKRPIERIKNFFKK